MEIKPDITSAINKFIINLKADDIRKIILTNQNDILEIFKQSKAKNLRSLKTVLFNFKRLFDYLKTIKTASTYDHHIFDDQIKDVLLKISAITFAHLNGDISDTNEIYLGTSAQMKNVIDSLSNTSKNTASAASKRHYPNFSFSEVHRSLNWYQNPINLFELGNFVKKGILPSEKSIITSFKEDFQTRKAKNETEDVSILWIKLVRWQFNDPNKLDENLQPVMKALRNFKFTRMGDILQVASQINLLIELNYNPLPNGESLEEYFTKYLTSLNAQNIPASFDELNDLRFDGYNGYEYYLEGAQSLVAKIKANTTKRAIKTLRNSRRLIDFISKDDFKNMSEEQNISFPLMNYVDVKDFARLINIAGEIHDTPPLAIRALINRYQNEANLRQEEQSWLKQLEDECQKQVAMLPEPFKTHRQLLLDGYFKNLILN